MCISNVGNRRSFGSSMAAQRQKIDGSVTDLLNTVALKDEFQQAAAAIATTQQKSHITVQHNYHDHSNDNRADYQVEHPARGGVITPFPLRLHEMLETVSADGFDHVISFQPHGRCFVVHKPKDFVKLLPKYFKLSKLASFQRQLNLYGFQRMTRGRDRGGYYHELFLKDRVFLAHSIQRIKVKGTGVRARSNPDQEPNFWTMPWVSTTTSASTPVKSNTTAPPNKPIMSMETQVITPIVSSFIPSYYRVSTQMCKQPEDDVVCAFGNKTFHYLDPFEQAAPPTVVQQLSQFKNKLLGVDELLATEAETFFDGFDFPDNIGAEIEDDAFFGRMLEHMIA